jgi:hypothetical protein
MSSIDRRSAERRKRQQQIDVDRRRGERRKASDRREAERVPLELWMEEVSGDDVYFRRTGNVSVGGVFFDRAIPHALSTIVTLKFALPGDREMVVARGEVVSIAGNQEGLGMGVKFITIEGDGEKRIRTYLKSG